jgi:transposase InsO family protein
VYIKPRTPRLNGKVERFHRIDAEEFYRPLDGVVIDDAQVFNDKLREWEDSYNATGLMAASTARHPMGGSGSERPRCNPCPVTCTPLSPQDRWSRTYKEATII